MTCPYCGMYPYQHPNDDCPYLDGDEVQRVFDECEAMNALAESLVHGKKDA